MSVSLRVVVLDARGESPEQRESGTASAKALVGELAHPTWVSLLVPSALVLLAVCLHEAAVAYVALVSVIRASVLVSVSATVAVAVSKELLLGRELLLNRSASIRCSWPFRPPG